MKLKCPVLILDDGIELEIVGDFKKCSDLNKSIIRTVFAHTLRSGLATTQAYWETARLLGFASPYSVQKVIQQQS